MNQGVQSFPVIAHGKNVLYESPSRAELAEHVGLRRRLTSKLTTLWLWGLGPLGSEPQWMRLPKVHLLWFWMDLDLEDRRALVRP